MIRIRLKDQDKENKKDGGYVVCGVGGVGGVGGVVGGFGGYVVCGGSHFSVFITSPLVTLVRAVGICMLNVNPHVGIDRTPTSKNSVR